MSDLFWLIDAQMTRLESFSPPSHSPHSSCIGYESEPEILLKMLVLAGMKSILLSVQDNCYFLELGFGRSDFRPQPIGKCHRAWDLFRLWRKDQVIGFLHGGAVRKGRR